MEFRRNAGAWSALAIATASSVQVVAGDTLQFRVSGQIDNAGVVTITNASTGGVLIDTTIGTAASPITGSGSTGSPYTAPGAAPTSCLDFVTRYAEQANLDGIYHLAAFDAYCDMTTDTGGWTLVARVLSTSTTHVTATALDTLVGPMQATTAKLADATINAMTFTRVRENIASGTIYAIASSLILDGTAFNLPNAAAAGLSGPYTSDFLTQNGCSSDCGAAVAHPGLGFGDYCGYQYFASGGNHRPGMGCKGSPGQDGTVWIR